MKQKIQKMIFLSLCLVFVWVAIADAATTQPLVKLLFDDANAFSLSTANLGSLGGVQTLPPGNGWVATDNLPPVNFNSGQVWSQAGYSSTGYGTYNLPEMSTVTVAFWLDSINVGGFRNIFASNLDGFADEFGAYINGATINLLGPGGSRYITADVIPIETPTWTHVAYTYDAVAGVFKLYINGVSVPFSGSWEGVIPAAYDGLGFSFCNTTGSGNLYGFVDNIFIFDSVLTLGEVQGLMGANSPDGPPLTCAGVESALMLQADINKDCSVDFNDCAVLADEWLGGIKSQTVNRTITLNANINAPAISAISVDGNLSDWARASEWAVFGNWYPAGAGLTSTSRAKYAWNDAGDMLYVGVESTESRDIYLEVGGLMGNLCNPNATPMGGLQATQIQFKYNAGSGNIDITNQITGNVKTGVVAAHTWDGTKMTIEIAIPIYANWFLDYTKMVLSQGMDIYLYANVASADWSAADSQVIDGQYIPLNSSPTMVVGSKVTLVP